MGRRIREIRGFGANQAQFALELGVSQGQLSRYEQGISEIGATVLLRLVPRIREDDRVVVDRKRQTLTQSQIECRLIKAQRA